MPNHITNILFVTGDAKVVDELKAKIYRIEKATEKSWNREIGDEFPIIDFGGTVPFPKELEGTTSGSPGSIPEEEKARHAELLAKYGWGTKWNAYDVEPVQIVENGLKFQFNTAGSPPTGWLDATAHLYPSLYFEDYYKDEGGGCGIVRLCVEDDTEESEDLSDHDWYYQFDENYQEQFDLIASGDYQAVIDRYKDTDELDYYPLYEALLERIKDEDLPLFIKFNKLSSPY